MSDPAQSQPHRQTERRQPEREAKLRIQIRNRQNAQHSTGPRTAAGKASSSRNAFRHGHYSAQAVIEGEPVSDYEDLRQDLLSEYAPVGHTECALVEELTQSRWRVLRFRRHEARIMEASERVYEQPDLLFTVHRLMAGAERAFYRVLRELTRLQETRVATTENTLDSPSQPAESEDTCTESGFVSQNQESADRSAPNGGQDANPTRLSVEMEMVGPATTNASQEPGCLARTCNTIQLTSDAGSRSSGESDGAATNEASLWIQREEPPSAANTASTPPVASMDEKPSIV